MLQKNKFKTSNDVTSARDEILLQEQKSVF
jgi:hypothetical protein